MAHRYVSLRGGERSIELLVVGITHERSAFATVQEAQRLVHEFKPNVFCAEAEPRWVEHMPEVSWGRALPSLFACIDRPEKTTRRRLAQRLAFSPINLYKSRRLGTKADAQSLEDIHQWRSKLQEEIPQMYEVLHEEREEYMAWRTLLAVEQYLLGTNCNMVMKRQHHMDDALNNAASSVEKCVARRRARLVRQLNAVRRRATGKCMPGENEHMPRLSRDVTIGRDTLVESAGATATASPDAAMELPRVAIVCGVAHVDALAEKLGDCVDVDILNANADIFPCLLRAIGCPMKPACDTRVWERLRYLSSYSGPSAWPLAFFVYGILPALFVYFPLQWDYHLLQENLKRRNIVS